jgi:hypothetical protein
MSVAMNFKMSEHQKSLFDYVANAKNVTKTSILKTLIEGYCRDELKIIKEEKELATKAVLANKTYQQTKEQYEPRRNRSDSDDLMDAFFSSEY